MLRTFYGIAEKVLLPEALIDELIGDEVMALYVPSLLRMLTSKDPDADEVTGLLIGNVGDDVVRDFTAVGDVVNTASRLQAEARSGEVIASERLARHLKNPAGVLEHMVLKGKQQVVDAYRVKSLAR